MNKYSENGGFETISKKDILVNFSACACQLNTAMETERQLCSHNVNYLKGQRRRMKKQTNSVFLNADKIKTNVDKDLKFRILTYFDKPDSMV